MVIYFERMPLTVDITRFKTSKNMGMKPNERDLMCIAFVYSQRVQVVFPIHVLVKSSMKVLLQHRAFFLKCTTMYCELDHLIAGGRQGILIAFTKLGHEKGTLLLIYCNTITRTFTISEDLQILMTR